MKGQFMLISSVLIGFIVISAAGTISEVQERSFESDGIDNTVEIIKQQAQEVNQADDQEVRNFIRMVSMISEYNTETVHWESNSCFNVTLSSTQRQVKLECIG